MTRAKFGSIIVGSVQTLIQDPKWATLIEQLRADGRLVSGENEAFANIANTDDF